MGANRPERVYTLDDGTKITPSELAKELHLSKPAARCRLEKYTRRDIVFKPVGTHRPHREYKCKSYRLSDGTNHTAKSLAKKYDVPLCTIRNRLSNGITDIEKLKKLPNSSKQRAKLGKAKKEKPIALDSQEKITKLMYGRNFFDPLSRLLLRII